MDNAALPQLAPENAVPFSSSWEVVAAAAREWPTAVAIEDAERTMSFSELKDAVLEAAAGFIAAGLKRGDAVGIWAPNVWEWIVTVLGLHAAGGVLVPLNTRYKGAEAGYILEKSEATMLFTVGGFLDTEYVHLLRCACGEPNDSVPVSGLPKLQEIVLLRGDAPQGTQSWADFLADGKRAEMSEVLSRASAVEGDFISDILFTSGTTGNPKGVMTTHAQNLQAFWSWSDVIGLSAGDRYLIVNPFFHAFGYKAGILAALMRGATILPHAVFDAAQVMKRIATDRVTMLPGPPALYQTILAHPDFDSYDMSTLRLAVTGAAVIPVSLIHEMRDRMKFDVIVTGYGLTEVCGVATMCRHDDDPETIATTSGRAIDAVEVRVVDDNGTELPRGEAGEIVVRGYNTMLGYFKEAERTREAIDDNGWLHTGDVGVMDERGYIKITDRKKDMFIVGGFNAYPAEIETLMLRHPAIAQATVVGAPDKRLGEVGVAFVVVKAGETLDEASCVSWCRENMANFKVPRSIEFVDEFPRNALGKVQKFKLLERAAELRANA